MGLPTLPLAQKHHGNTMAVWLQGFPASASSLPTRILCAVKKATIHRRKVKHDTSSSTLPKAHTFQLGKGHIDFTIVAQMDKAQLPLNQAGIDMDDDYVFFNSIIDSTQGAGTDGNPGLPAYTGIGVIDDIEITLDNDNITEFTLSGSSSGTYLSSGS